MKSISLFMVVCLVSVVSCQAASADSIAILKQGLLGAGTGAVASAMSGGKGERVWQGALAGAGVMVVGGALLDMMTTDQGRSYTYRQAPQQTVYVSQPQQIVYVPRPEPVTVITPVRVQRPDTMTRRIYRQGFRNGYRQGYNDGYEDALNDMYYY